MTNPLARVLTALLAFAACSDSHDRSPGSQTHFVSCKADNDCNALGAQYTCQEGRCQIGETVTHSMQESGAGGSGGTKSTDAGSIDGGRPITGRPLTDGAVAVDAAPMTTDAGTRDAICDGSDGFRLGVFDTGGFPGPSPTARFMMPMGAFAVVDGQCHFYATWNGMQGIVTGTLDAAEADQLASEVQWNMFATYSQYKMRDPSCADGGGLVTSDGTHSFACLCMCDPAAPQGLFSATVWANKWVTRLAREGTALTGPVTAAASVFSGGTPPPGDPQAWPLLSPITAIVFMENTFITGQLFDDPNDSAALRAMRVMTLANFADAQQIYATDGAQKYLLYVRDELDGDAATKINAFRSIVLGLPNP